MTNQCLATLRGALPLATALAILGSAQPADAQTPPLFQYSVKFVCGLQRLHGPNLPGEPAVKPGNYATEINIHNIQFSAQPVFKSVVLVVKDGEPIGREPRVQPPTPFVAVAMPPRNAMMDDCNQLWDMAFPGGAAPPNPMPLTIGYLSIISRVDIDVDAVYTAKSFQPTVGDEVDSPSIDVERVLAKRVSTTPAATLALPKLLKNQ
ncbi:MAG TPA: hypothetical protein VI589_04560 [Vicinamibacteria bacterium]